MVDSLCPVLDTKVTRVFRPMENTNQHTEFRLKVLSFLNLGALGSVRVRAKAPPPLFVLRSTNFGRLWPLIVTFPLRCPMPKCQAEE